MHCFFFCLCVSATRAVIYTEVSLVFALGKFVRDTVFGLDLKFCEGFLSNRTRDLEVCCNVGFFNGAIYHCCCINSVTFEMV